MRNEYEVVLSELAQNDLEDIVVYISKELNEPSIALRVYDKIVSEMETLSTMPERHEVDFKLIFESFAVRKLYVDNYIAPYIIDGNNVVILRVLYSKRDLIKLIGTN